mmetsp:Transcript_70183/g.227180  ORF Transcript_70183/g.227180 Transcript_70183/m.227180 type:complete len:267 (-) Transcript_70183:163-963(-)
MGVVGMAKDEALFVGQRVDAAMPSDSDHNAILFHFGRPGGEAVRLLSWNILCRYGCDELSGVPFDGFNRRSETENSYASRLLRTASEVRRHVEAHKPHAVLLQECPEPGEYGHGMIAEQLEGLARLGYRLLQEGEFVTAVLGGDSQAVELPPFARQGGKLHAVHSAELGSLVLNVHLRWDELGSAAAAQTRGDLEAVLSHLRDRYPGAEIFLAGAASDAETIEQLTDGLGHLCHPPGPTNVHWSGHKKRSELTYADFAFRCPLPIA